MKRVTGIGGVFFKAKNADALREWYREHLGIPVEAWGGAAFSWQSPESPSGVGTTVWSIFATDVKQFGRESNSFMVNYRVHELLPLIEALRAEGCDVDVKVEESEFGKFGWVTDPEGNRVELWEPPAGQ
jgi:predicted enzyme related to lactoylglutathione lyase